MMMSLSLENVEIIPYTLTTYSEWNKNKQKLYITTTNYPKATIVCISCYIYSYLVSTEDTHAYICREQAYSYTGQWQAITYSISAAWPFCVRFSPHIEVCENSFHNDVNNPKKDVDNCQADYSQYQLTVLDAHLVLCNCRIAAHGIKKEHVIDIVTYWFAVGMQYIYNFVRWL